MKKTNIQKKILFIFLLLSFTITMFPIESNAIEEINVDILKDKFFSENIQVSIEESNGISIDKGVVELGKITQLGTYKEGNYTIFNSRAEVFIDLNFYSSIERNNMAHTMQEKTIKYPWCTLFYGPDVNDGVGNVIDYNAQANYMYYDRLNTNTKGVNMKFPIIATIQDLTPKILDYGNDVFNITTKSFIGNINQIVVVDSQTIEIGKYDSHYEKDAEFSISTGYNEYYKESVDYGKFDGNDKVYEQFNDVVEDSQLGITAYGGTYSKTLQQGATTRPSIGSDVTNGIPIKLIPDIQQTIQNSKVRYRYIAVDTYTSLFGVASGWVSKYTLPVKETIYQRPLAYKITNFDISIRLKMIVDLYAKTEVSFVHEDNPSLQSPDTQVEDIYEDVALTGDSGILVTLDPKDTVGNALESIGNFFSGLFGWIIWIGIIGIAGIIIFIIIKSRSNRKSIPVVNVYK